MVYDAQNVLRALFCETFKIAVLIQQS